MVEVMAFDVSEVGIAEIVKMAGMVDPFFQQLILGLIVLITVATYRTAKSSV